MPRWQPYDVVGGAYSDDTRQWSVQDTVNYLVVNAERPGGRSNKMLRDAPGMVTFCASMPESSVRGLYVAEGRLFAVVGTTLYSIGTDGLAASLGTIPGVGRCVFTHNQITNGNEVVIGNGQSGYVYDTVAGTLTQITDEGFPGFRSVDFADQYVIGVEPFGRYWFHSDLADAKSYNTLDRAEAEKAPDRIQQAIATGGDILALGERTLQFFYNTGAATGTWANRQGAEQEIGAASPWTACRLDNTVYWLGNDGSVYRLNGYVPQRISTHALEQAISRCTLSDAYAFTFEDRGHKCYLLTFPDGQTWCFDAATQEWTRRESYGFDRWRVSALVKWGRHWIAGDFINGRLYQLDWNVKREADEPLERRRVTGVLHDDQNRLIVNAFELVFDTGMDESSPPLPVAVVADLAASGDVPDGYVNDAVSGSYTASGGVLPLTYSVIGSMPPGVTLNASTGVYSGTFTAGGSYSWTVRVTDASGDYVDVADSAVVTVAQWWLTTTNGANAAKLWQSSSLASWGSGADRTPSALSATFGPIMVDTDVALIAGNGAGMERITDFDPTGGHATTSVSLPGTLSSDGRIRAFGDVVVALPQSGTAYYTSADRGATWATRNVSSGFLVDVARLDSGRWIATLSDGGSSAFLYSDEVGAPTTWQAASSAGVHVSAKGVPICCNGTVAATVGNSFGAARTTDGGTWTAVSAPAGATGASAYDAIAVDDTFLTVENGKGAYFRSTDAGQSWARSTGETGIDRLSSIGTTIVASKTVGSSGTTGARYTTDGGATWSDVTMPYSTLASDVVRVINVRYVP